ncbi:MAG: carbohydrate-binding protein, partial [Bacteroidales bacterium]|nr:carbohydrate-binding protein [Bacteroidales bacterium]
MKNSIFNSILLAGAVLGGLTACEDSRNAYLEDYQTMVYFRNGGQQEISVYQTGEDAYYSVPV